MCVHYIFKLSSQLVGPSVRCSHFILYKIIGKKTQEKYFPYLFILLKWKTVILKGLKMLSLLSLKAFRELSIAFLGSFQLKFKFVSLHFLNSLDNFHVLPLHRSQLQILLELYFGWSGKIVGREPGKKIKALVFPNIGNTYVLSALWWTANSSYRCKGRGIQRHDSISKLKL